MPGRIISIFLLRCFHKAVSDLCGGIRGHICRYDPVCQALPLAGTARPAGLQASSLSVREEDYRILVENTIGVCYNSNAEFWNIAGRAGRAYKDKFGL